jgi:hypothetical protein
VDDEEESGCSNPQEGRKAICHGFSGLLKGAVPVVSGYIITIGIGVPYPNFWCFCSWL